MSVWAVIPLRGFALAKSRLASVLGEAERSALNRDFFSRVTGCAVEVLGGDRVMIVSPDAAVIGAATGSGLDALHEPDGAGLNGALQLAKRACEAKGATAILSLNCDLPCLTPADIRVALEGWPRAGAVMLATDEAGSGTNALAVPAGADFVFQMGPDSAARHRQSAIAAGLDVFEIRRFGLGFDVDTPDDLIRWRALAGP